ncbi:unnamed protein product [Thelazia callipaeda]|uniref:Methyltransf_11 domain-containing protein n=1 Tax=Thelazia callipaeda TaxID=103827 RepID=A0A0N5CTZ2_THECL|nr:unnamed protein product [Thelazia callipaeda]
MDCDICLEILTQLRLPATVDVQLADALNLPYRREKLIQAFASFYYFTKYLHIYIHASRKKCFGCALIRNENKSVARLHITSYFLYLRSNSIDAALLISVLHHFATLTRRKQALLEVARCLKPLYVFLIYFFNFLLKISHKVHINIPYFTKSFNYLFSKLTHLVQYA